MNNATQPSGVVRDGRTYTSDAIAGVIGRNVRWTKEFIRRNVHHHDAGGGLLMVSGRDWRLAIERLSETEPDPKEEPDQ
ncbi:hypothetical protein [Crateriforma conspicua]|uniref:Uncharacterized protein n=1 Tax=Crateriforma conspicua TaxID=2527996 RepID=A0A5C5Y3G8_9PLAN|nr:hypothetical protein [Crateriforma conspicua]TWT69349.1 hypothetical protein Pan14r_16350 [Crateriforma conspicua]